MAHLRLVLFLPQQPRRGAAGFQAEFGYTKAQLGTVLMALKLAYGVGQFINGQMAEHWPPRKLLAIGLLASAALNVVFGWATALYFLTFIWACNGYVQALGLAADDARRGELVSGAATRPRHRHRRNRLSTLRRADLSSWRVGRRNGLAGVARCMCPRCS